MDGGSQIILANIVNQKKSIFFMTFNLGKPQPIHEYVMVNRSILCDCEIESGMTYFMHNVGSFRESSQPASMNFTINMAFFHFFSLYEMTAH